MLKQLKYFQSVVRLGSFSAVAEENFISQSAISQQVQSLEHELGFALLVRRNRSFSLTPAGEYFYRKSLLLTADCDRMCAEAAKIAKREAEQEFSRIVLGFPSEFLYAENLEEARLLVAGGRGFLPLESGERQAAEPLTRVPLVRNGEPLLRTYCAFWKKENVNPYVPEFARLLKGQFDT